MDPYLSEPGTSQSGIVTEQPKPSNLKPKSYLLEQERPPADVDDSWEFVGKVPASERSDSISSATALEEALSESKELREKHAKLLRKLEGHETKIKRLQKELEEKNEEMMHIHIEPPVSHGPSSDLSSGSYQTPLSSLSQSAELQQQHPSRFEDPNLLFQLQKDNEAKDQQILKLSQEVTQLNGRLEHAGGVEGQLTRLTMEASTHEEEKKKLQKQIEQLRCGVQPQPSHRGEADVSTLQQECKTLRQENGDLQNRLEITKQHENQYREESAQLKEKLVTAERKLHSEPVTYIDGAETDETQKLRKALQDKESEIRQLRQQQESYQKTATEFGALQEHSKKQSKQVMQLRSHVDAVKIGETERAEYEQSLMESLHSVQDQYDNLMKDYQAVSRDRGFMEKSLTALKKRNEELISKLQQCEAKMEELKQKEESARLQWESMRDGYRALNQKYQELFTEKQKLEEENKQFIDNTIKISNLGNENADLQRSIIAMRKEKEDLWNELQAVKAEVFKEDFEHEREDRAKAHAQIDDVRTECTTKVEEARRELQLHKERLAEVEAVNTRKVGELRSALEEALAARQEVQAKTSQVKQYKKQVDSLKAQVTEAERQNTNLIQEMERVRTQLVKAKVTTDKAKKEDEKKHKKKSTEKVPGSASSPVALPPPAWESRFAELERINEELQDENDKLKRDNEVICDEAKNLQKMIADLKGLVHQQHADRAQVPPRSFPPGTKSDIMQPTSLSPIGGAAGDPFGVQHPHPPSGYGQDQQQIRQQLQQGFQQQSHTEEHTAGAGGLTSLPSGPPLLSEAMHQQPLPLRARILPPDSLVVQPLASRSSEVAQYSDRSPTISPTAQPYHNWPPGSGAANLQVLQQPGAKAITDPQMMTKHQLAEARSHSSYPATDSNLTNAPQNVAHQRHVQPQPPSFQRQRSGSGSSPHGQQQQQTYIAKENPLMQHIDTDIQVVVSQVSEERSHQPTMQHVPYDPNLVCAYCNKQFRMGEIQKYKHHVGTCGGSDGTEV